MDFFESMPTRRVPAADDAYLNATNIFANALAGSAGPSAASEVAASDQQLSSDCTAWVQAAKGRLQMQNGAFYSQMVAFFSNVANMPAVRQAMSTYGFTLAASSSWLPYWRLWKAAYYINLYPVPAANAANCAQIQTTLNDIQAEITNVKNGQLQGIYNAQSYTNTVFVLNDLTNALNGLYGQLSCDQALGQQSQISTINNLQTAVSGLVSGAPAASGSTQSYLTYGLYAVGGLFVIGALALLFRRNKPAA